MNSFLKEIITTISLACILLISPVSAAAFTMTVSKTFTVSSHFPVSSLNPLPTPNIPSHQLTLQGAKLEACQKYATTIVTNSNKATAQANVMYQYLTNAAVAAEAYYKQESTLTHKTLSNYNTLVTAIQTSGKTVPGLMIKAQKDINSFSCFLTSPSERVKQFSEDITTLVNVLVNYQTAVINLMAGVISIFPYPSPTP